MHSPVFRLAEAASTEDLVSRRRNDVQRRRANGLFVDGESDTIGA